MLQRSSLSESASNQLPRRLTGRHRYGEVVDIDMPRDKNTGKRRGFAFLMYEDQRSTILAVDNLNGAQVLNRTLRVDHVKDYKQKELVDGKWTDRETERLNARPELIRAFPSRLLPHSRVSMLSYRRRG
jgi:RNA recognition motif-containing protein